MAKTGSAIDHLCVNTIRTLSIDMVQKANSGHPGLPMGAAAMAHVLFSRHLRHNPGDPGWLNRDRFVLSAGHGSALLYSLLHLFGYDLSVDDLKQFRQWGSRTPGHPEIGVAPGVEATTGPLGQGAANAVGMAMAERQLAGRFNRDGHEIFDHFTYALVSDGDLMEGLASEAVALAGHLGLGRLVYLYDSNDISLDGPLSLCWSEDVAGRFAACGWQVLRVEDGDQDLDAIDAALTAARAETGRPTFIEVRTTIGYGSPGKAGSSSAHGSPLGEDELARTKQALGFDPQQSFQVPAEAAAGFGEVSGRGVLQQANWQGGFESWRQAHAELAADLDAALDGGMPVDLEQVEPGFEAGASLATRKASGAALNALAARIPWLIGGDADLSCSTNTNLRESESFDGKTGRGRNIHFGVREHAMAAIANGMCYHGGVRPFVATFFVFSDYMRPALRMAALNHLPVIAVFTHDSIAVGEDGPTHQPVEHLMSLRVMPNLHVIRPGDAHETFQAWCYALRRSTGPTALVLSRQGLPTQEGSAGAGLVAKGAYVLAEASGAAPRALLLATGSEVALAMAAREVLEQDGVPTRVVSIPCFEAFLDQPAAYREEVLPASVGVRVAVEAGATLGWERFVGERGRIIGLDRYGASAPGSINLERLGFSVERVVGEVRELLG